jgi:hypothetical protein
MDADGGAVMESIITLAGTKRCSILLTLWTMTDIEALAFVAVVAIMVVLSACVFVCALSAHYA